MINQADGESTKSPKMPGWCRVLNVAFRMYVDDDWWKIIERVADGVPSEIDYITENWTHERIARQYALEVQRRATESHNI